MTAGSDADELARLRARAYGRDADIQADPHALQRLNELENAPVEAHPGGGEPPALTDETPTVEQEHTDAEPVSPLKARRRSPLSRRALAGVWISSVLLAGFAGAGIGAAVGSHDPSVIAVLSEAPGLGPPTDFEGPDFPDAIRFQDYLGLEIIAYTMPEADGTTAQNCIAVADSSVGGRGGCLPPGLDTIAVIEVTASSPRPLRDRHPAGSIIQFTRTGDRIEVRASE
ncbi:hypothetical protein QFZ53_000534 [Microbacterium natoriense]|uniref:Uncharacterized protein n=1 Tax=Microbacterium natoriense TaxID=284570 RepID=A0AAW8ESU5_9MICO|nr:hypothetical protein [Microbacterium natoriense]MDQ0646338.1 hypothetical protein [Microbacterium natoriense]